MFRELTTQWETNLLSRTTFRIVPIWQSRDFLEHTMSKEAEGYYIRCSFANNDTRSSRARFSETNFLTTCLRCQQADETVKHVFLECPKLQPYRNKLFSKLKQHHPKIKINLTTLLTRTEIMIWNLFYTLLIGGTRKQKGKKNLFLKYVYNKVEMLLAKKFGF